MRGRARARRTPLEEVFATDRPFSRAALERRLYDEGYEARARELCGQGG